MTGLPAAGEDEVTIRLRSGAVKVSDRSRDLLRRGRTRTFRAKAKQTPVVRNGDLHQGLVQGPRAASAALEIDSLACRSIRW